MTYFTSGFFTSFEKRLQIAEITISGSPAADGYYTLSSVVTSNFDSGTNPTGGGTDTLTFSQGSYMFRATLDVTRSATNHNYKFQFEANNSLIGIHGQTALYTSVKADLAEAPFSSTSPFTLKLKCTGVDNSAPTLTNKSKIFVWRVN